VRLMSNERLLNRRVLPQSDLDRLLHCHAPSHEVSAEPLDFSLHLVGAGP